MSFSDKAVEKLNQHKIGLGTAVVFGVLSLLGCVWLWQQLNVKFVDHAEASEHITWSDYTLMDKSKNIRLMEKSLTDYEIDLVRESDPEVKAEIQAAIIRLKAALKKEQKAVECLKSGKENCELF